MPRRSYGNVSFETSNEDRILFPDAGITKGDLMDYYEQIAPVLLPHVRDRPVSMHRYPRGIQGERFYQKQAPEHFPHWIERVEIETLEGSQPQILCQNRATLAYLAQQACITPHVWLSKKDRLHHPDQLLFDLDPPEDGFEAARSAARHYKTLLDELGLPSFLKTTGSKGLHIVVPLDRSNDFDAVRDFARDAMQALAHRHPDELTTEQRRDKRKGRVYLDISRNAYAQNTVPPYAVRGRPGATVATPIHWDELDDPAITSSTFTVRNIFDHLDRIEDPWRNWRSRPQSLKRPRQRLDKLLAEIGP